MTRKHFNKTIYLLNFIERWVFSMSVTHTLLHVIDSIGNDISLYPENTSDDVKLSSDLYDEITLSDFIDSIKALAFKDNIESSDILVKTDSNSHIPKDTRTLDDLVSKLGKNAFSSATSATTTECDADGVNIKENYLKKIDAQNTYISKIDANKWIKDGQIVSTPSEDRAYVIAVNNKSNSTEFGKKNPNIFIEGDTLTAPNINGKASFANHADVAVNSMNDGNGNNISNTYASKEQVSNELNKYVSKLSTASWDITDRKVTSENSVTKAFLLGSTTSDSENGTVVKNPNIFIQGSTITAPVLNGTANKAICDKNGNDITSTYFSNNGGEIKNNPTITNDTSSIGSDNTLITKKFLQDTIKDLVIGDISEFVDAMSFKGTVGTAESNYHNLPVEDVKKGYTYKVITNNLIVDIDHSSTGEVITANHGDLLTAIDNYPHWTLIPSGNEPTTHIRYDKNASNLTDKFATGDIILGEAATKQIATVVGETDSLITDTAVKKELLKYFTKAEGEDIVKTDNKVETSPTVKRIYVVGSDVSDTATSKLGKSNKVYIENGTLTSDIFNGNLNGNANTASRANIADKANEDRLGNVIDEFYPNKDYLSNELLNYVNKSSTVSWAITDRNVASILSDTKFFIVGSENENTNTSILNKNKDLFYENGVLHSPSFKGALEGKASSATLADSASRASCDKDGNLFSDYYVAKKDTVSWDVTKSQDTHVTNKTSETKFYLVGSPSSVSSTETQVKSTHIYAEGSTLTSPIFNGDVKVNGISNSNINHTMLSEILNSLGSMAFRNGEDSLNPKITYVFDGGSPADLIK